MVIIEYQQGMENWDIPYFEGIQSVKMPVLTTIGKNFVNSEMEIGNFNSNDGSLFDNANWQRSSDFIALKSNTQYQLNDTKHGKWFLFYDKDRNFISSIFARNGQFTTPYNCAFVKFAAETTDLSYKWQIELGNTITEYEPYKSNILSTSEDVELRGVGEVRDELNLLTGEVTERIGKIILDGTQSSVTYSSQYSNDDYYSFIFNMTNDGFKKAPSSPIGISCPITFQQNKMFSWTTAKEYVLIGSDGNTLIIKLLKSKLNNDNSISSLNTYLASNPITINYPLKTESVKTVDLNVVDQNNTKIDKIHVFDEVTHVNASSDELTPTVNISKSVSYPTVIKPNTKYTIDLKRNNKPLTVNLGGTEVTFTDGETRKTITTPSTLVNDKLSYYGIGAKCNEIMLIEGEIERNIDYFTGMQSVVMQNQMPKCLFYPLLGRI